jgi:hypothetical protein
MDRDEVVVELCRRVLAGYYDRQAKVYQSRGQLTERDVCLLMGAQIRSGSPEHLHHLAQAVRAAQRGDDRAALNLDQRALPPGRKR